MILGYEVCSRLGFQPNKHVIVGVETPTYFTYLKRFVRNIIKATTIIEYSGRVGKCFKRRFLG